MEQSSTVWHSSLTRENSDDLERVKKAAIRIILGPRYQGYLRELELLCLDTLFMRREKLCLNFARKSVKSKKKLNNIFPLNLAPDFGTRNRECFKVYHAKTNRMRKSPVIHMQKLLNKYGVIKP